MQRQLTSPEIEQLIHRSCNAWLVIGDFVTERLELRPMRPVDLDLLVQLNSDRRVMEFITGRASTVEETADDLDGAVGTRWLAFEREGMEFVGWVGAIPSSGEKEYDVG